MLSITVGEWFDSYGWNTDYHYFYEIINRNGKTTYIQKTRLYKNRYEPRRAISGILKRNLYNLNNFAKFIRCFIAVISVTELLHN